MWRFVFKYLWPSIISNITNVTFLTFFILVNKPPFSLRKYFPGILYASDKTSRCWWEIRGSRSTWRQASGKDKQYSISCPSPEEILQIGTAVPSFKYCLQPTYPKCSIIAEAKYSHVRNRFHHVQSSLLSTTPLPLQVLRQHMSGGSVILSHRDF